MGNKVTYVAIFLCVVLLIVGVTSVKIKVAARKLPTGKTPFVVINGGCRQNSEYNAVDIDWNGDCERPNDSLISIEIRDDIWWWWDSSIGLAHVSANNLGAVGETVIEELWDGNTWRGTIRITTVSL